MGFIEDLIGAVVPKSIYDPGTGKILGGIFGGGGGAVADPVSPAPSFGGGGIWGDQPSVAPGETWREPAALAMPWWQQVIKAFPALPGAGGTVGAPVSETLMPLGGTGALARFGGGALARRIAPPLVRVVASAVLLYGGEKLAVSIYNAYLAYRRAGYSHKRARRQAHENHGISMRRRRMRPTNVHALRRAIRRVRGFQRITRKVHGLGMGRSRGGWRPRRRAHFRRGDVSPFMVEDYADELDEAEEYGLGEDEMATVGE